MAVFTREQLEPLSKGELIEIILKLDARVTALEAQLREVHSAKAPFGKGKRKAHPKRPGRGRVRASFPAAASLWLAPAMWCSISMRL